jgi:hypothetical protein
MAVPNNRTVAGSDEHDCDFPEPTQGAEFVCPECRVAYFTAVHRTYHQWVWISEETGRART